MDTHTYKKLLEVERDTLRAELASIATQNPHNPADWVITQIAESEADENVVADHTEAHIIDNAILADLETRYNNVLAALVKISDGTYGTCEVSGEPIEEARLMANPAARTCLAHTNEHTAL